MPGWSLLPVLELIGIVAFAINGAFTAITHAKLDIVGVITLGILTALGGGILRDVIIGSLPPATFMDGRYLAAATIGSLIAFFAASHLHRFRLPMEAFDAVGLGLFAVAGAVKALEFGLGPSQAVLLGGLTGVGGGTVRDVLVRRVPAVLSSSLYAVPALVAATIVVVATRLDLAYAPAAITAAAVCFAIRMAAVVFDLNAPGPPVPRAADAERRRLLPASRAEHVPRRRRPRVRRPRV